MDKDAKITKRNAPDFKAGKLAFLVQLPMHVSPGQRFRCENWIPYLQSLRWQVDLFPFFDEQTHKVLYTPGQHFEKVAGTFRGFLSRFRLLFSLGSYDFVFVQREASPIGPPILEWIIAKILRKRIIFDFDDAIWIHQTENKLLSILKCYWKVAFICRWSYKVSAGNVFLASYAQTFNRKTFVVPTVVDTHLQHNTQKQHEAKAIVTIGWTGSHSTLKYLELVSAALWALSTRMPFELLIIADRPPANSLPNMRFIRWRESTEVADLLQMDIGIMPLETDAWSEGKCGFKIIQYLALGIPAVASPVGVNRTILTHGGNGFLCTTQGEWEEALGRLVKDAALRQSLGIQGRHTITEKYSIESQLTHFTGLFS